MLNISASNFEEEVIQSDKPVLVDFWAEWCGPCKMMNPILDNIAKNNNNLKVVKVNIDEEPELASKFRVMSIPTMFVFNNGKIVEQLMGAMPEEKLSNMLDIILSD